ncbi:hypothetical protein RCH33_197 [Flavobacterium daejeonense]|nr:hypothetical protein RCH33_197 [Flavobacterium daejeonense]
MLKKAPFLSCNGAFFYGSLGELEEILFDFLIFFKNSLDFF